MNPRNHPIEWTRRQVLRTGLLAAGATALPGSRLWAGDAAPAKRIATAKSIIQIWMWGGPTHLDTFDPKPEAGAAYCGPLTSPIGTNVDGIRISELLPQLATQADKYTLIRSMTHGNNGHETAAYITQTGRQPGSLVYPTLGAIISRCRGYDAGYTGEVPPYIVLTEPQGRFSEAGFLGPKYKPFATGGNPALPIFAVEGIAIEGVTPERMVSRRELLHGVDLLGKSLPEEAAFRKMDQGEEKAYQLTLGDTGKLFDLNTEDNALRDRYGRNTFGQSCLMARRLVEKGVPYITINYKGWDTHKQNFETMRRKLPEFDSGLATLIQDLQERGLLGSTIIWCGGEFGRTPKILMESPWNGGRGHWGSCFSSLVAGGGFKGGTVVGESDSKGEKVQSRPVLPQDLHGSICELMGLDPDSPLPNSQGIDAKIMPLDAADWGIKTPGRLHEIM